MLHIQQIATLLIKSPTQSAYSRLIVLMRLTTNREKLDCRELRHHQLVILSIHIVLNITVFLNALQEIQRPD